MGVGVGVVAKEPRVGVWVSKEGEVDMAAPLMGEEGSSNEVWAGEVGEYGLENVGIHIRARAGNIIFFILYRCRWCHNWYS